MIDLTQIVNDFAVAQLRVSIPVTPDKHRGWTIHYDPPPIPVRSFDWTATHPDFDASWEGDEDGWVSNGLQVQAATREELIAEIDAMQDELDGGPA